MFDIVAIGELLIDFTPLKSEEGVCFQQNAGGAPCNMLTSAQKLGGKTAFIGKVGKDQFGFFLADTLVKNGVSVEGLVMSEEYGTTLAFVHLDQQGERSFSFYRKGCADIMLTEKEINYDIIHKAKAIHFGSLSFSAEPSRSAVEAVVKYGKAKGKIITYDPNYRPALWDSKEQAIEGMKIGLKYADILKVSQEEAFLLTNAKTIEAAAEELKNYGISLVCITLGDKGVYYSHPSGCQIVPGFKSKVIDTTGAGDSFFGSTVYKIIKEDIPVKDLSSEFLYQTLRYSNAVASLCIESFGGIPSMPSKEAVEKRLSEV